ncbi:hypothetical protein WJX77_003983 [Trebouxia sp. C0004]
MVEARQGYRAPVVFGSQIAATSAETAQEEPTVDVDEDKLKARAARFCTDFQAVPEEPAAQPASKPKAVKPDFSHGLDLLSQDEVEKRKRRAAKFGTALVDNGLKPALTARELTKASRQDIEPMQQEGMPAGTEIFEAEAADQAEQRRQTAMTAERRPDSVHLFGVDLMSTADCLHFFTDFAPVSVDWLNDTSCNVVFRDGDSAMKAIQALGTSVTPEEGPDGLGLAEADVGDATHVWHKGQGMAKGAIDDFPVPFFFRSATMADIRQVPKHQQNGHKQGGGRGRKAGRGKGKGRGRGQQQQQQQQQQKRQYEDMDGDVEMKHRGERGGKRFRQRKAKAMGLDDVEMQEVEDFDGVMEYHPTNAEVRQAVVNGNPDLSEYAHAVEGPSTLFSATAAGAAMAPRFQHYAPVPTQDIRQTQLMDYNDV